MDIEKARHESIRWLIMIAVNAGRPEVVAETLILSAVQSVPIECTARELRRELGYLEVRKLIAINRLEGAPWTASLTQAGIDVVEYTVNCDPGIARPKKYW